MQLQNIRTDCQITNLSYIVEGPQEKPPKSLRRSLRNLLGPVRVRALKKIANNWLDNYARIKGNRPIDVDFNIQGIDLKPGDLVRVRPLNEIRMTLNHWGQLKGCSFAPEMEQYCDTTQRILKSVERFVDERDFRILRTKGIYILEGINCPGVASLGRCDRNCFFFWRVEWLEKTEIQSD